MVCGGPGAAGIVEQFLVALPLWPGVHLIGPVFGQGVGFADLAGDAHAADQGFTVDLLAEEIWPDLRRHKRIWRADVDRALAFRPTLIDPDGHAWLVVQHPAVGIAETAVHEEELAVGRFELGPGAHETVADSSREGQDAAPGKSVFDDLSGEAQALSVLVQGNALVDPPVQARGEVIPIVLADAWQLM